MVKQFPVAITGLPIEEAPTLSSANKQLATAIALHYTAITANRLDFENIVGPRLMIRP